MSDLGLQDEKVKKFEAALSNVVESAIKNNVHPFYITSLLETHRFSVYLTMMKVDLMSIFGLEEKKA